MCDHVSVTCELTEHDMEEFERVFPITVVYLTFLPPFFPSGTVGGCPCSSTVLRILWATPGLILPPEPPEQRSYHPLVSISCFISAMMVLGVFIESSF